MIRKSQSKAFTIIEILLVMFMILLFTGLTLVNYKSGGKHLALQRSANQLSQDIRRTGQKAMSTAVCDECGDIVPDGGYGIYLERGTVNGKKYILYADDVSVNGKYDSGSDHKIGSDMFLENGVYIHNIEIDGGSTNFASINFLAPEPTINISDGASGAKLVITLALEMEPTATVTVKANIAGLVEVE